MCSKAKFLVQKIALGLKPCTSSAQNPKGNGYGGLKKKKNYFVIFSNADGLPYNNQTI
jgi:hypothetical protein